MFRAKKQEGQSVERPQQEPATPKGNTPEDKPLRIHVTRNGDIYVDPKDVLESEKFKRQVEKMARIPVIQRPPGPR